MVLLRSRGECGVYLRRLCDSAGSGVDAVVNIGLGSLQNVSKNSAVALRILKASHRLLALQFHGL